jgi:hypothetical protein
MEDEVKDPEQLTILRDQFDLMLLQAQVELIQKVDKLIKLLEKDDGQQEAG